MSEKVPCGGFTAGVGLKVDNGTVSVQGGWRLGFGVR